MSKELTALKALKELKKRYGKKFSLNDDERCCIIETALNRIPNLEKALRLEIENSAQLNNERIKDLKKLKALKEILVLYDKWLANRMSDFEFFSIIAKIITEYELLKEILK